MAELTHRNRSLDGLRGVAVFLVLLHHHSLLNSGWLGVDVFFVLSGFLITTILRRDREAVHFWSEFWIKRATRILPPLVVLLCVTGVIFRVSPLRLSYYLLSLGDVLAYARPFHPLDSMWSLAVEEHFYIAWPFAVRLLSRRSLLYLLGGMIVAEPLLRFAVSWFVPGWEMTYYLTPFRLDGLCLGCFTAICLESKDGKRLFTSWSARWLIIAGLLWILLRVSLGDRFTRGNPSVTYNALAYSVISLGAFALVAYLVTTPRSICARILSARGLVFCGSISYGLYLYQLVVREVITGAFHLSYQKAFFVDVPITFVLAVISYLFYERPLIAWGRKRAQMLGDTRQLPRASPTV